MTLKDFLLARIEEDAAAASYAATRDGDLSEHDMAGWWIGHYQHYPRHNPQRVLDDCEVKRRIVWTQPLEVLSANPQAWRLRDQILRLLALPYADHPDYRKEWEPS